DRQTREALTDLLDALGYSSASAADGRDALGYLERHDLPDLILMDLRMPEMSGWNFRIQLQRSPMLCRIPVVVFSATPALEAQARALKVNDHLRKPLDPERLIDLLRRYCHAPGPA